MIEKGVLYNGLFYTMLSHTESDIQSISNAFSEALKKVEIYINSNDASLLNGSKVKPVFRRFN